MKKIFALVMASCTIVVLFSMVFIFSSLAVSGEAKITGFSSKSFAIKGEVEGRVSDFAKKMKDLVKRNKKIMELRLVTLRIYVSGYADKTGNEPDNDMIAMNRAIQVASYLNNELPEATIISNSKGDQIDERVVIVSYSFDTNHSMVALIAGSILSFIAFCGGMAVRLFEPKKKEVPQIPQGVWIDVIGYSVFTEFDGKKFISPFKTAGGGTIERDSKKGIMDSFKGCLKEGGKFQEQRDALIKKGIIKEI